MPRAAPGAAPGGSRAGPEPLHPQRHRGPCPGAALPAQAQRLQRGPERGRDPLRRRSLRLSPSRRLPRQGRPAHRARRGQRLGRLRQHPTHELSCPGLLFSAGLRVLRYIGPLLSRAAEPGKPGPTARRCRRPADCGGSRRSWSGSARSSGGDRAARLTIGRPARDLSSPPTTARGAPLRAQPRSRRAQCSGISPAGWAPSCGSPRRSVRSSSGDRVRIGQQTLPRARGVTGLASAASASTGLLHVRVPPADQRRAPARPVTPSAPGRRSPRASASPSARAAGPASPASARARRSGRPRRPRGTCSRQRALAGEVESVPVPDGAAASPDRASPAAPPAPRPGRRPPAGGIVAVVRPGSW